MILHRRFFDTFQRTNIAVEQHRFELVNVKVACRCVDFVKIQDKSIQNVHLWYFFSQNSIASQQIVNLVNGIPNF